MTRAILIAVALAALVSCERVTPKPPLEEGERYHVQDEEACARQPDLAWCF